MKKKSTARSTARKSPDMLAEYDFDYRKAKPNRFAGRISTERVVVPLDPEVSQVFTTSESVNTVLRALITAMPESPKRDARRK
jgi:predicted Zn-dependent protease